jgi:hypothetical protein
MVRHLPQLAFAALLGCNSPAPADVYCTSAAQVQDDGSTLVSHVELEHLDGDVQYIIVWTEIPRVVSRGWRNALHIYSGVTTWKALANGPVAVRGVPIFGPCQLVDGHPRCELVGEGAIQWTEVGCAAPDPP